MGPRRRFAGAVVVGAAAVALGAAGCSGGDDDGGTVAELCAAVGEGGALTQVFDGFDPTDTERALEQLRDARLRLSELHEAAPDEVRAPLSTEIDYVDELIDALEAVEPGDPTSAVAAVNSLSELSAAVDVASGELQAFQDEHCTTTTAVSSSAP